MNTRRNDRTQSERIRLAIHLVLTGCTVLLFAVTPSFAQVPFSLGSATTSAGNSVTVPLAVGETSATYGGLHFEFPLPEGLTLESVTPGAGLSGFVVDSYTFDAGTQSMGGFIAYSGRLNFGADVTLANLVFAVDGSANPGDRTLTATASWLSDATGDTTVIHEISAGQIAVTLGSSEGEGEGEGECDASPPATVQATDMIPADRVTVSWSAVSGAQEYEVYRNTRNQSSGASLLGRTSATRFDDTTAAAPETITGMGCPAPPPTIRETRYYYWVRTVFDCGTSEFSSSDQGYRGEDGVAKSQEVFVPVLPNEPFQNGAIIVGPQSTLSLRVRSSGVLDHTRAWATVHLARDQAYQIHWQAVALNDGWVVITPEEPWLGGQEIVAQAGAPRLDGSAAQSPPFVFYVDNETAPNNTSPAVVQVGGEHVFTTPADSYLLQPVQPYTTPQTVLIPCESSPSDGLTPWLWIPETRAWHPGTDVAGWLQRDSLKTVYRDGQSYLQFRIFHGGRIGLRSSVEEGAYGASLLPAIVPGRPQAPVLLAYMLLIIALLGAGHLQKRRRRAPAAPAQPIHPLDHP